MKKIGLALSLVVLACHGPTPYEPPYQIVGECLLTGYAKDIALQGSHAFIADDQAGLQVVDVSRPDSMQVVGEYLSQKNFQGIAVRDTFAYIAVAASDGGVMVLNISDPAAPAFVGQDPWFYAYNVSAPADDTQYIYIAGRYWFIVEDVSYPQYPSYVRRFATPGNVRNLFVRDSLAYLACEQIGLIIYDLEQPDSTAQVGALDTPANARDVFVLGDHAYLADGLGGLVVIDVSDPGEPTRVYSYDTPGYAQGVWAGGDRCYVADREGGIQVFDISDPGNPAWFAEVELPYTYNVMVRDTLVYVVDRDHGLVILQEAEEVP